MSKIKKNCNFLYEKTGKLVLITIWQLDQCVKSVQIRSFSDPYFPVFRLNRGKYESEKSPYLNTFQVA